MLTVEDKIRSDLKIAVKEENEIIRTTLRTVLAVILDQNKKKEYEKSASLTNEEMMEIVSSEVKKRRDAKKEFERGSRQDLVTKEEAEIKILSKYLPEQLSDDELRDIINKTLEEIGASEQKDLGKAMGAVMAKVKGKADGNKIIEIVKEALK